MLRNAPGREPWDIRLTAHLARQAQEAANDPARRPENRTRRTRRDWVWGGITILLVMGSEVTWEHAGVLSGLGVLAVGTAVLGVASLRY